MTNFIILVTKNIKLKIRTSQKIFKKSLWQLKRI